MLKHLFNIISRGKLTILQFHKVPHQVHPLDCFDLDLAGFERVLSAAKNLFNILPLEDAVLALRAGNLPPRAACITFDDGYAEWLEGVVPMLEQHNAHATFFITSGQFTGRPLWNERILYAVNSLPEGALPIQLDTRLEVIHVANQSQKQFAVQQLQGALKYCDSIEREELMQSLESAAGCTWDQVPVLSAQSLRSIHAKGFGIGAHSVTHPILSQCAPNEAYLEIYRSREELEWIIGGSVKAFAYPNGLSGKDFGSEHVEMVRRAGFTAAVTTHRGVATSNSSVFQLPRFSPWGPTQNRMEFQFARNLWQRPHSLKEETVAEKKKVLMVAFHFPPQSGSSGILRTLNFVKYLPENGWQPTVLTASARAYAEQRNDLVASIPPQTKILRGFALDAARHFSIANKYPLALALPDRWSSWWLGAVWAGLREIRQQRPDLIWSTYPISTAHLIGGTLSRLSGIPWIADFRDPMVTADHPADGLQRRLWRRLERRFMQQAVACIFTSQRAALEYSKRYPAVADKCSVIENGFEEEAFEGVQPNRWGAPKDCLLMLHSGLIYPKDRNPSNFFAAVHSLITSGGLDRTKLCIRFRAPQHGEEVRIFAEKYGIQDLVDIAPPISYKDAIAEMMGADVLLVFQGSNFNAQIPAKIYEYIRAKRPILALLDPIGDTAAQLSKFKEGIFQANIDSQHSIEKCLLNWLYNIQFSISTEGVLHNMELVKNYSRKYQAEILKNLLDKSHEKILFDFRI